MDRTEDIRVIVDELLQSFANSSDVSRHAAPSEIVIDSLDQMRFLVALEDRLGLELDEADLLPFDLRSRDALVVSIAQLLSRPGEQLST